MDHPPITSTLLLDQLKDPAQQAAWAGLDARYRRMLIAFARSLGMTEADAEDVAQWTLAEFARSYQAGGYERGRGRLRSWITGIARNRAAMIRRAHARRRIQHGESAIDIMTDESSLTRIWEQEQEREVFRRAMEMLQQSSKFSPTTLKVFDLVAVRGQSAEQASVECGITVDEVYVAKSRLTRRLRELVQQVAQAYEEDA
jgi:RNA polymerase sigma-70 factor, ECF subfamily